MSIADHEYRAEQFLEAFPLFKQAMQQFVDDEDIILNSSLPTENDVDEDGLGFYNGEFDDNEQERVEEAIGIRFDPGSQDATIRAIEERFQKDIENLLPDLHEYLMRLSKEQLEEKRALIEELKTIHGWLFWQHLYMYIVMVVYNEIQSIYKIELTKKTNLQYRTKKRKEAAKKSWNTRKAK